MQYIEEFLRTEDQHDIPLRLWRPKNVSQILVIAHGMAEYCERYSAMAEWLIEYNIAVVALNHRGHGMDCHEGDLGFFAESHGWQKVLDDLDAVIRYTKSEMKGIPITLLGHSMGSFIAQSYIQQHTKAVDNLILMSTNGIKYGQIKVAKAIVGLLKLIQGPKARSKFLDKMSFGSFNSHFKPNRSDFDWLSRDNAHVDAYVNDPYCGFLCTNQMWWDLLGGFISIDIHKWPKQLPLYLLSGADDPLGERGKGITRLKNNIQSAGLNLIDFKLYPGARHELVNETNALEVWEDIKNIVQQSAKVT
ncbi:MAG: alpha/beta fold hydrolase [Reinekea sp.]|jgi:alpha-beta hydrolase superfamily lysophospholipase